MYKLYIYIQFIHYHDHRKYQWIKWFRQSCHKRYKSIKEVKKRAGVDAILNQIIKNNDCVAINKDCLAARLNYLPEHNVIVKKKYNNIDSYSLNENAQTDDSIEVPPSCTPDIPIPNVSIDPNEVVINATLEGSPNISTIDTPTLRLFKPTLFTNVT